MYASFVLDPSVGHQFLRECVPAAFARDAAEAVQNHHACMVASDGMCDANEVDAARTMPLANTSRL